MKNILVISLLLAAALCAAALQTSESEALSPNEISEIVRSAEAESPFGAHNSVILTSDEEPSSDLEDAEDEEEAPEEEEEVAELEEEDASDEESSSDLEDAEDEEEEDISDEEPSTELETTDKVEETSDLAVADQDTAAAKRKVVINIWGRNGRKGSKGSKKVRRNGKKGSKGSKKVRRNGKKGSKGSKKVRRNGKKGSKGSKKVRRNGKKGSKGSKKGRRNSKKLNKHTKKIHRNGHKIKKLGRKILKTKAGKVYKVLIAQIRRIAQDSAKAISALERKIRKMRNGKSGSNGKHGMRGPRGPKGLPGKNGKSADRKGLKAINKKLASQRTQIAKLRKRAPIAGPRGLRGKNGKDGKRGPRGAPGKNGKNGKDSTALDKKYIAKQMAKFVQQFNKKIAAVSASTKAGNAQALKRISTVSVKLGNQIQSVAKNLRSQIRAVKSSTQKALKSTKIALSNQMSQVRKMKGPRGAPGKNGVNGARGARGPRGATGARGPQGVAGARGPQGAQGPRGAQGAKGGDADLTVLDVCGVSGGDDRTCSRNPGQGYAYSVGDPHYRTWDGAHFDIQPHTYWGEIVLVQHRRMGGGDIEVQTATVPWFQNSWSESTHGRGGPKGNTGLAISAWGNVIVFYARNGLNSYFMNGQQRKWHNHGWTTLSAGIKCAKSGAHFNFLIDKGTGYLRIWGNMVGGNNMDIRGHASGHWATGKSLSGAWGDWDGNAGNDQAHVHRLNAAGRLSVLGTPRSYFKNKKPRTSTNGQFMLAFDMELDSSESRVIPGETITMDLQSPTKLCPEKAEAIAKNCKGVFGGFLRTCGADICLKVNPKLAGKDAHENQVSSKQIKLLAQTNSKQTGDTCMLLNEVKEIAKVPISGSKSFSFSFFIKEEGKKLEGTIAKKGDEWELESNNAGDVIFTSNGVTCRAKAVIGRTYKNVIAVSSDSEQKIKIIVEGKEACSVAAKAFSEPSETGLQLGSISAHVQAKVAKPTYVASGIRSNEFGLFTKEKPQCSDA